MREISSGSVATRERDVKIPNSAKLERNSMRVGECVVGIGALQTLDWDTSAINLSV